MKIKNLIHSTVGPKDMEHEQVEERARQLIAAGICIEVKAVKPAPKKETKKENQSYWQLRSLGQAFGAWLPILFNLSLLALCINVRRRVLNSISIVKTRDFIESKQKNCINLIFFL